MSKIKAGLDSLRDKVERARVVQEAEENAAEKEEKVVKTKKVKKD